MSVADIAKGVGMSEEEVRILFSYFEVIKRFEQNLQKL
jgi:signal recognition particle GTPase